MAATTKRDLLVVTQGEFGKLMTLLISVDAENACQKDDEDTSIRDVIGHRAHWIGLFLGWYADGLAGETVYFPAEGYKWNQLKLYNANLRAAQAGTGWHDTLTALQDRYGMLVGFIEGHSETELYGGPMQGANNQWTPGRWAEAAGPSHFRSAAKYVRAVLKKQMEPVKCPCAPVPL